MEWNRNVKGKQIAKKKERCQEIRNLIYFTFAQQEVTNTMKRTNECAKQKEANEKRDFISKQRRLIEIDVVRKDNNRWSAVLAGDQRQKKKHANEANRHKCCAQ